MPRQQLTNDELLGLASEVVTRYGFDKTSMADLAKAAGTSKGLLYLRFTDKDSLLAALLDREFSLAVRAVASAVDGDPRGGLLSRAYHHSLFALRQRPLLLSLYTNQDAALRQFVQQAPPERYRARIDAGRRYVDQLAEDGMIRDDLGGKLTDVLSVFAFGLATTTHAQPERLVEPMAELVALAVDADVTDTTPGKDAFRRFAEELISTVEGTNR